MRRVEYSHNNSGGRWWLTDQNWADLEKAGWKVHWYRNAGPYYKNGKFLGAKASSATREGMSMLEAVAEWERITSLSSTAAGCPCCGQPHYFTEYDGERYIGTGPTSSFDCSW